MTKKSSIMIIALLLAIFTFNLVPVNASELLDKAEIIKVENLSKNSEEANEQMNKEIENKSYLNNSINFDYVNVEASVIDIEASLKLNDETISLKLNGQLKQIDTSKKLIVGELNDFSNRYEVLHFSMDKGSENAIPAFLKDYDKNNSLNIYLKDLTTNEYIFIQTAIPNELNQVFNYVDTLDNFEAEDLLWYSKVINYDEITESTLPSPMYTSDITTVRKMYKIDYTWSGVKYAEFIQANLYLHAGDLGYYNSTIEKYSYTFNYSNNTILAYETTSTINNVDIRTGITKGTLTNVYVGGVFTSGQNALNISASLEWSASVPVVGIPITVGFTKQTTVRTGAIFVNKPTARALMDSSYRLQNNGDQMNFVTSYTNAGSADVVTTFNYSIKTVLDSKVRTDSVTLSNNVYK